jgi:hypothetical protein
VVTPRLTKILAREDIMDKQRSRVDFINEGYRNMGSFQAKAKQRTKANKITTLKWPDGSLCTLQGELKSLAANIYQ